MIKLVLNLLNNYKTGNGKVDIGNGSTYCYIILMY